MDKNQNQWCEFSTLRTPSISWRRYDKNGDRFYYGDDGGNVAVGIGITSVLAKFGSSPQLQTWKDDNPNWRELLNNYSEYGTLLHVGLGELAQFGKVDNALSLMADERWGKGVDFKKDMLAIRKFFLDYKVEVLFIEGILGRRYETPKGINYITSAIDLFVKIHNIKKVKKTVEDGVYKRASGNNKAGDKKYKEVTVEEVEEVYAIVDLKSNYTNKVTKGFFDSHRDQLIFGRKLIAEEYGEELGIKESDIKMLNLSPLGWSTEPKYTVKQHEIKENANGYLSDYVLDKKIELLIMGDKIRPKGLITEIGDIEMNSDNLKSYTFEEFASKELFPDTKS
jgi:hypothetical protein